MVQACKRCNHQLDRRTQHDWSGYKADPSNPCLTVQECARCGEKKEIDTNHDWSQAKRAEGKSCNIIRICLTCETEEVVEEKHTWGEWKKTEINQWQQYLQQTRKLYHLINSKFNKSEVQSLFFELGIDYDNIQGSTKSEKVRGLIIFLDQRNLIDKLLDIASTTREDLAWPEGIAGDFEDPETHSRIERMSWDLSTVNVCKEERACKICGETESRVKHQFSDWVYRDRKSCVKVRTCSFCGKKETSKETHSWSEEGYLYPDSCKLGIKCKRCGTIKNQKSESDDLLTNVIKVLASSTKKEYQHNWEEWKYASPGSCSQIRFCRRCNKKESKMARHDWGNWEAQSDSVQIARCRRCKMIQTRNISP